jgi:hypothetical protein
VQYAYKENLVKVLGIRNSKMFLASFVDSFFKRYDGTKPKCD